jgi:hypothetical protein
MFVLPLHQFNAAILCPPIFRPVRSDRRMEPGRLLERDGSPAGFQRIVFCESDRRIDQNVFLSIVRTLQVAKSDGVSLDEYTVIAVSGDQAVSVAELGGSEKLMKFFTDFDGDYLPA